MNPTTTRRTGTQDGPGRTRLAALETADRVLAPTYVRPDTVFVAGEGAELRDSDGTSYLDLTSGIAVTALGHGSSVVADALRAAADGLTHVSNLYHTEPAIELASDLVDASFADRVFFTNSGAEAVEGAIKFARLRAGEGRRGIVHFDHSFHGRTYGALAATDRPDAQAPFEPLPGGFTRAAWNDHASLAVIDETVAAVIAEPVQGEGGVRPADPEWLRAVRSRCDEVGALLVLDEIQCGLGRTGKLWAYEHHDIEPDLMTLAKPLAGGLPMGAVLMTEDVASTITPGCHGTTFGGGPVVASVARRVLEHVSDPTFLGRVAGTGAWLRELLEEQLLPRGATEVRGIGMLLGIRVPDAKRVVAAALEERLLVVGAADEVVRLLPPLNIERAELEEAVRRLGRALERAKE